MLRFHLYIELILSKITSKIFYSENSICYGNNADTFFCRWVYKNYGFDIF